MKLLKITKLIEEEDNPHKGEEAGNLENSYPRLESLASSMKLEEKNRKLISSLLNDISNFALFLSDLTITFYNFDKMRFNALTRVNEPLTDLESNLLDVSNLFNFYIQYFFSDKVYSIIFNLF